MLTRATLTSEYRPSERVSLSAIVAKNWGVSCEGEEAEYRGLLAAGLLSICLHGLCHVAFRFTFLASVYTDPYSKHIHYRLSGIAIGFCHQNIYQIGWEKVTKMSISVESFECSNGPDFSLEFVNHWWSKAEDKFALAPCEVAGPLSVVSECDSAGCESNPSKSLTESSQCSQACGAHFPGTLRPITGIFIIAVLGIWACMNPSEFTEISKLQTVAGWLIIFSSDTWKQNGILYK